MIRKMAATMIVIAIFSLLSELYARPINPAVSADRLLRSQLHFTGREINDIHRRLIAGMIVGAGVPLL